MHPSTPCDRSGVISDAESDREPFAIPGPGAPVSQSPVAWRLLSREDATVSEPTPGSVVTRLRSLPRTTVLAVCVALVALVVTVMSLLDAPTWARIVAAILVFGLALASEA